MVKDCYSIKEPYKSCIDKRIREILEQMFSCNNKKNCSKRLGTKIITIFIHVT